MNTLILVLAFVILGFLAYKYWMSSTKAPKAIVAPNKANVYMFYTNWCGHSKKAMPEWKKLEKSLKTSSYYGKHQVEAISVDCEEDVEKCTLYGINAYPTVIVETNDGITDFNKGVTFSNIKTLLLQTLGEERESL